MSTLQWVFGIPSRIEPDNSSAYLSVSELSEEENKRRLQKNKLIKRGAFAGVVLLFFGFILQFLDTMK
jgi:hypothetical protein